jgi:DNA invertase Pin-like site-specific DNA recombinase
MRITVESPFWLGYIRRVGRAYRQHSVRAIAAQQFGLQVAIYSRVSTEEQARDGYSIDEQLRDCRAYAERQGWQVHDCYVDDGYSGTNGDRPAFQRLLADAEDGRFHGVVTHKIDRAYRNAQGMLRAFSDWQKQNIFFASVKEQIDFTTPWGKLILGVLSLLAEVFVDNLREETKKGKRGRFHEGLHNGTIPWGYCNGRCSACGDANGPSYCPCVGLPDRHHDRHVVPHPVDSVAFRYAQRLYCSGAYTDLEIADALNAYQVDSPDHGRLQVRSRGKPGQKPGPFTKEFVRDLLQSPFYVGMVPYYGSNFNGEVVVKYTRPTDINGGRHIALISEVEFEQALQVRAARGRAPQGRGRKEEDGRGKTAPRRAARVYLLQGLLDCGCCGAPMHSQGGGHNRRRHICWTRLQRHSGCSQPSVSADALEDELAQRLRQLRLPPDWQESVVGHILAEGGLEAVAAQRRALQEHFDYVKDLYRKHQLGRQQYRQEWLAYQRGMAALDVDRRAGVDLNQARALLADFGRLWVLLRPLERKTIVQTLLDSAVVDGGHIVDWRWYPVFQVLFGS